MRFTENAEVVGADQIVVRQHACRMAVAGLYQKNPALMGVKNGVTRLHGWNAAQIANRLGPLGYGQRAHRAKTVPTAIGGKLLNSR